ncbi:hypothetical protein CRM94_17285 [Burkholderia gladioli]|uniref:Uncharacterized protein n=1 Tax=Burkholderia gladioli TaxID=28095 RepID=A0A2A7S9Y3_BURGA|nr:hypothetical protein CRM94_17285 [Burkholderia gladioli]
MDEAETEGIPGITEGFYAVRHRAGTKPFIAVHHSDDGGIAFTMPKIRWSSWQINVAIAVYETAFARGERYGAAKAQRAVRESIGITHI